MSKDRGTKNVKKPAAKPGSVKSVSDYKSEGKVTSPGIVIGKDDKSKSGKGR